MADRDNFLTKKEVEDVELDFGFFGRRIIWGGDGLGDHARLDCMANP